MTKKEFLKNSDSNILKVEFDTFKSENGPLETGAFLVIGHSKKQIRAHIENLSKEELDSKQLTFQQFEILLTREELEYLLSKLD